MQELHLISVIIPVYNVENYLRQCLDSICGQSYSNLEIIIVNDGSTDNSGAIGDEYALKDERVRIIHKSNGGLSSARNAGLDIAKGEYIIFVDSDDYISLQMCECLYYKSLEQEADLVCAGTIQLLNGKEHSCPIVKEQLNYNMDDFSTRYRFYDTCLNRNLHMVAWNKLYHRHIFSNLRFARRVSEDSFSIMEIYKSAHKIVFLPENLYYYRCDRKESIMHTHYDTEERLSSQFMMYLQYLLDAPNHEHAQLEYYYNCRYTLITIRYLRRNSLGTEYLEIYPIIERFLRRELLCTSSTIIGFSRKIKGLWRYVRSWNDVSLWLKYW